MNMTPRTLSRSIALALALTLPLTACGGTEETSLTPCDLAPAVPKLDRTPRPRPEPPVFPIVATRTYGLAGGWYKDGVMRGAPTVQTCLDPELSPMVAYEVPVQPGALHVWVSPRVAVLEVSGKASAMISPDNKTRCTEDVGVSLVYWTDAATDARPLPAGEFDLGAWARRLYVGVRVRGETTIRVGELTGSIRYEFAQL
jgi:hypothetical protein